jgi:predicted amidohydrolase
MIIDPRGTVLADAASFESVITADVDAAALAAYRREFPALDDMRPEFCSW